MTRVRGYMVMLPLWRHALLLALVGVGVAAKKKPPQMNIPGLGGGLGGGPPWRKAIDKVFTDACAMNKGRPSVFCFPDKKELIEALQVEKYGLELDSENFLMDLHVVVQQLFQWPPAWMDVIDIMSTSRPWTKAFCDKIIGSGWWNPVPLVRKSFISPRQTLVQLERDMPVVVNSMNRWFELLRQSSDGQAKKLLKDFKESDKADAKNKSVHARPMMRLMQHVHAKVVRHLLGKACKGSSAAWEVFERGDANNLTLLHHAASLGDVAGVKAIVHATPKKKRGAFAAKRDLWGYTAQDWAKLSGFDDVSAALEGVAAPAESGAADAPGGVAPPTDPVALFGVAKQTTPQCEPGSETCAASGGDASSAPRSEGGWPPPTPEAAPAEWMPPTDKSCSADVVDVAQFEFEVFMHHYVLHPRPLLVRGGAQLATAGNFTRAGLLEAAGDQKVETHRFPGAKEYDGSKPVVRPLHEYVDALDERSSAQQATKKLHFFHKRLSKDEVVLNFSATLPELLDGKVIHTGTMFYVGGLFMGTPPHHGLPAADSLMHGMKTWFLQPPGHEALVNEAMYDHLVRTGGAPGSQRCLQQAGDLLFVPRAWTSGDLCLGHCVGVTHEFTHEKWDLRE